MGADRQAVQVAPVGFCLAAPDADLEDAPGESGKASSALALIPKPPPGPPPHTLEENSRTSSALALMPKPPPGPPPKHLMSYTGRRTDDCKDYPPGIHIYSTDDDDDG